MISWSVWLSIQVLNLVTVRVAKFELAPVRRFAVRPGEFGHDRFDVAHVQVDQGVGPGITPVLGQERPRPAKRDRHERRQLDRSDIPTAW